MIAPTRGQVFTGLTVNPKLAPPVAVTVPVVRTTTLTAPPIQTAPVTTPSPTPIPQAGSGSTGPTTAPPYVTYALIAVVIVTVIGAAYALTRKLRLKAI